MSNHIYYSAFTLLLAVLLPGCETPYKAHGALGGYTDNRIGEDHYWIKFQGNGFSSIESVKQHWRTRATELCGGRKFEGEPEPFYEQQRGVVVAGGLAQSYVGSLPSAVGTAKCVPK